MIAIHPRLMLTFFSRSPTTVFVCFSHDSERSFPEMLDITYDRLYRTVAHKETIFCPEVLGIEAQYMRGIWHPNTYFV